MKYVLRIKSVFAVLAFSLLYSLHAQAQQVGFPNSLSKCPNGTYYSCGFGLIHSGGKCVHPKGGAEVPANGTPLILFPACSTSAEARLRFKLLSNGSLYHISSGKCVHPESGKNTPVNGTRLVFWTSCTDGPVSDANGNKRLAFEFTSGGSIRHKSSGLCVHPAGGSANPATDTELVLWSGCNEYRLQFTQLPF